MSEIHIISSALGLFIGLVLALTGAGGALLAIPLLVYCFDLSILQAAPIALLAIFLASGSGAIQGLFKGVVRYKAALLIAGLGIVFAPLGVFLAQRISNTALSLLLLTVLLYIAFYTWQKTNQTHIIESQKKPSPCEINPATSKLFWTATCTRKLIGVGTLTGFLSGLLGVGGGFVIVPSLKSVSNFTHETVIATSLAVITLVSISGVASYWNQTDIHWQIAIPFMVSTLVSMLAFSSLRNKIPTIISQRIFASLALIAAIYIALNTIPALI